MAKVYPWKYADSISDRIVDIVNEERTKPEFSPLQMMAGQMLAMLSFLRTAPLSGLPMEIGIVEGAINGCLRSLLEKKL